MNEHGDKHSKAQPGVNRGGCEGSRASSGGEYTPHTCPADITGTWAPVEHHSWHLQGLGAPLIFSGSPLLLPTCVAHRRPSGHPARTHWDPLPPPRTPLHKHIRHGAAMATRAAVTWRKGPCIPSRDTPMPCISPAHHGTAHGARDPPHPANSLRTAVWPCGCVSGLPGSSRTFAVPVVYTLRVRVCVYSHNYQCFK